MALGDKGPALVLSKQAMAVVPLEKDAVDGPPPIEVLARLPVQSRKDSKIVTANVSGIFDMKGEDGKTYLLVGKTQPVNAELADYAAKTVTFRGKETMRDGFAQLQVEEIRKF